MGLSRAISQPIPRLGRILEYMKKTKNISIEVQGTPVSILSCKEGDYISLTDMLRAKDGDFFFASDRYAYLGSIGIFFLFRDSFFSILLFVL